MLLVAVLAGLLISWMVLSMVPREDQLKVEDPKPASYQGAEPNAQKYGNQPAK